MQHKVVIIAGSTGVGKTDLALHIAQRYDGEIINADVGQLYTPCTIGTAKPDWKTASIPHHFFDYKDEPEHITVVHYRDRVAQLIAEIVARKKLPIIVGGSTFYIASLFFPPHSSCDMKAVPTVSIDQADQKMLWQQLETIDPERAKNIHPHDTYRLQRALSLWYEFGVRPSLHVPVYNPIARHMSIIILKRETGQLYERIATRTRQMIDCGWIEEVRSLQSTAWEPFLYKKKLIGYDDIFTYLLTDQTAEAKRELIETITRKTRQYAKRQNSFWRMLEKKLEALPESQKKLTECHTLTLTGKDEIEVIETIERYLGIKE